MTEKGRVLMQVIQDNPGIWFRELMRRTSMKNGVLDYHLTKMERMGIIRTNRSSGYVSYSTVAVTEDELRVAKALQRSPLRTILLGLASEPDGMRFAEIVSHCGKSKSTVSQHLGVLVREGLVEAHTRDGIRWYRLACRHEVEKMMEEYRPSFLDRPASGLEDIIGTL